MDREGRVDGRWGKRGRWAVGATAVSGGGGGDAAACDEGVVANRGGGSARVRGCACEVDPADGPVEWEGGVRGRWGERGSAAWLVAEDGMALESAMVSWGNRGVGRHGRLWGVDWSRLRAGFRGYGFSF